MLVNSDQKSASKEITEIKTKQNAEKITAKLNIYNSLCITKTRWMPDYAQQHISNKNEKKGSMPKKK